MGRELYTIGVVKSDTGTITIVKDEETLYAQNIKPRKDVRIKYHSAYLHKPFIFRRVRNLPY